MSAIPFKRGGTFVLTCSASGSDFSFDDYTISSAIRLSDRRSVALEFSITDAVSREFTLTARATDSWTVGAAFLDLKIVAQNGDVYHTETAAVDVQEAITP
jgi:hypothetical protein